MKRLHFIAHICLFIAIFQIKAQIPAGYYTTVTTQTGAALKTVLYNKINAHIAQSYTPGLWIAYNTTDKRADGTVWDVYTNCPFVYGQAPTGAQDNGTGGTAECQKYNREHSFPQAWFGNSSPSNSVPESVDLFHVIPADKYVNGKRGDLPYSEVGATTTYIFTNGSKVGNSTFTGYSGQAYEPADEYKGDLARNYFYMATCYENKIAGWEQLNTNGNIVMNGTAYPAYEVWYVNLMAKWHNQDPISQKEIDRNNAVYTIQGNRNPYIDHPEYAGLVWNFTSTGIITTPSPPVTTPSAINNSPTATNFTIAGQKNLAISGTITGFGDIDNEILTIRLLTTATGLMSLNPNGKFSYIPQQNFIGIDTKYYSVCDPHLACVTAQIVFSISGTATTSVPSGLVEYSSSEVALFPNPSDGEIYIDAKIQDNLLIYNIMGEQLNSYVLSQGRNNLDLRHLPKGIYFYSLGLNKGKLLLRD